MSLNIANEKDMYPTLAFSVSSSVEQPKRGKFHWVVSVHAIHSDDVVEFKSSEFASKHECTMNFLANFMQKQNELLEGMG